MAVYLLSLPLHWAPIGIAFVSKIVLLGAFVWLLLRFDVITDEERSLLRDKLAGLGIGKRRSV